MSTEVANFQSVNGWISNAFGLSSTTDELNITSIRDLQTISNSLLLQVQSSPTVLKSAYLNTFDYLLSGIDNIANARKAYERESATSSNFSYQLLVQSLQSASAFLRSVLVPGQKQYSNIYHNFKLVSKMKSRNLLQSQTCKLPDLRHAIKKNRNCVFGFAYLIFESESFPCIRVWETDNQFAFYLNY
jgi:hypothetical protein